MVMSILVRECDGVCLAFNSVVFLTNVQLCVYDPATGMDYDTAKTEHCAGVVFLCTLEAFLGLIYAGMCAAILFGKVNRVQSHAHLSFGKRLLMCFMVWIGASLTIIYLSDLFLDSKRCVSSV